MRLTNLLKKANPVQPTAMSPRGRSELRALVGEDNVPIVDAQTTTELRRSRRTVRWLAPIAAAVLVVAGVSAGLFFSDRPDLTSYAFADTITATVMPGEVTPVPLGTSIIIDMPYPAEPGQPVKHDIRRIWLAVGNQFSATWGWTQVPGSLTFALQQVVDGTGVYQAQNWPYDKPYDLIVYGPQSPSCTMVPTNVPQPDPGSSIVTYFLLCAPDQLNQNALASSASDDWSPAPSDIPSDPPSTSAPTDMPTIMNGSIGISTNSSAQPVLSVFPDSGATPALAVTMPDPTAMLGPTAAWSLTTFTDDPSSGQISMAAVELDVITQQDPDTVISQLKLINISTTGEYSVTGQ